MIIRQRKPGITFGEIAKSYGFDSPLEMYNKMEEERQAIVTFQVGDMIILPTGYKPTHFNEEKRLPLDTPLKVITVSTVGIFGDYQIQIEGHETIQWDHENDLRPMWFDAEVFIKA